MAIGGLPESHDHDDEDMGGVFSEINITPLTDVFLVLLIIFMVTTTAITQSGVKVNLPKAGAASNSKQPKSITVSVDSSGKIFLDQKPMNLDQLEGELRKRLPETSEKSVVLSGDRAVLLGQALKVMDVAKKAGAEHFGIATKSEK
jgi:biopolymer transport protein ExbD